MVYYLHSKAKAFSIFKFFHTYVKTQFSSKIKTMRSDSGGNTHLICFKSSHRQMIYYLKGRVLPHPNKTGNWKKKMHHLLDVVRTLMLDSFVPSRFWCEALSTTVHLINRLPSQAFNNDSPFLRLFGKPPNYFTLRTFCCVCYVHL